VIVGVLLAAGAGRRFGGAKQLAPLDGRPLLQHAIDTACGCAGLDRVVVVLGAEADAVAAAVDARRAELIRTGDWEEGLAASLRAGIAAAGDAEWIVITLGDEPALPPAALDAVVSAARTAPAEAEAVRARWAGRPGHPVALRGRLAARADSELRGDVGARALLEAANVLDVDCTPFGAPHDVDTPADLEALRS
jgi:CTP:molybdopterin cytidylyltransferase MocA